MKVILAIETATLAMVLAATALILGGTVVTRVAPMPTSDQARAAMLKMTADLHPARIYELDVGWGGLAQALARQFPETRVIAIEMSPLRWAVCRLRAALFGPENLEEWGDVLKTDLSDGVLIACFLCPALMTPLDPKFRSGLKPGAHVISNTFALPGWSGSTTCTARRFTRTTTTAELNNIVFHDG